LHKSIYKLYKKVGSEFFWGDFFDSRFYVIYLLSKNEIDTILDIGGGVDVLLHSIPASNKIEIDTSLDSLKKTKILNQNIELIQSDARYLPFRNQTFQNILAMHLFPVMKVYDQDWQKAVSEVKRIANKNSELFITGANRMSKHFEKTHELEKRKAYLNYEELTDSLKDCFNIQVEGYGPHSKIVMYILKKIFYKLPEKFVEKLLIERMLFRLLRSRRFLKDGRSYVCICKKKVFN